MIDVNSDGSCTVYFIEDLSGVFDSLGFFSEAEAAEALQRNGFSRYAVDKQAQDFLSAPKPPFEEKQHPTDQFIPQEGSGGNFNMHYQTFERSSLIIVQIIYINRH